MKGKPFRISAEVLNVLVDPLQGNYHVQHAHVACRIVRVKTEKSEQREPVVDSNHHHLTRMFSSFSSDGESEGLDQNLKAGNFKVSESFKEA